MNDKAIVMKRVAAGYALALALFIAAADAGWLAPLANAAGGMPWFDEVGHFLLMGLLALLFNVVLRGRRLELIYLRPRLGSLIVVVLVAAEEMSQIFIASRRFAFSDLACDFAGIIVFGIIYGMFGGSRDSLCELRSEL